MALKKTPALPRTILFVDDESLWLDAVKNAVNETQITVMTAGGAEEALEKMLRVKPDLILSDVRMPDMNGFDLFEKVKSIPDLNAIPYVFMSSLDDFDARKTARDLGADDYVEKPFDLGRMSSIISELLLRFSDK